MHTRTHRSSAPGKARRDAGRSTPLGGPGGVVRAFGITFAIACGAVVDADMQDRQDREARGGEGARGA